MSQLIKLSLIIIIYLVIALKAFSQNIMTGHVRDENGKLISGAIVTTVGRQNYSDGISDNNGYFEVKLIKSVELGSTFTLRITAKGYKTWTSSEVVALHKPIDDIKLEKKVATAKVYKLPTKGHTDDHEINELIDDLFNSNDDIISAAQSQLMIKRRYKFSTEQIKLIMNGCRIYEKRGMQNTDLTYGYTDLLTYLSENQNYSEAEIFEFIEDFKQQSPGSLYSSLLLNFIKKSNSEKVNSLFKQLVVSRDNNVYKDYLVKDSAMSRFLLFNNLQDLNFYVDYVDQFKNQNGLIYTEFIKVISTLAPNRKDYAISLLNNKELVDSFFKFSINYEENFIQTRVDFLQRIKSFITESDLNQTYFFSVVCPCFIKPYSRNQSRKLPCDSLRLRW